MTSVVGQSQIPISIEIDYYKHFMKEFGFIKYYPDEAGGINHLSSNGQIMATKESVLINDIWNFLIITEKIKQIKQSGVMNSVVNSNVKPIEKSSVGDMKIFLMAILAIKGNKRLGVTPPETKIEEDEL